MKKVVIYTTSTCPYCNRAKSLLNSKDVKFLEINIETSEHLRAEMISKTQGRKTVPQIFIDDYHVGGCDDLYAHEQQGKLDKLLFT